MTNAETYAARVAVAGAMASRTRQYARAVSVAPRGMKAVASSPTATSMGAPALALQNSAMTAMVGTLAVQRSGCGGSCGCGGTCGGETGEGREEEDRHSRSNGAATTPVQRLAPSGLHLVRSSARDSTPRSHGYAHAPRPVMQATLGALQSRAGNAAVTQLLASARQPEREQPSGEAEVQRLGLEDLLPDWISGAIFGAKDKAAAGAAHAHTQGQETEHAAEKQAEEATKHLDAELPKLAKESANAEAKAHEQMALGHQSVAKGKADIDKASGAATKQLEQRAAKTQEANTGKKLLEGEQPSCSLASVMNSAENVADIVGKPFGIKGSELLNKAGKLVGQIGANISKGIKAIAGLIGKAKDAYNSADAWVKDKLGVDIATIGKWALILSNPITASAALGKWVFGKVIDGAVWAGKQLASLASYAAKEGPALLASIKSKVGSWVDKLPGPLVAAINAIASPFSAVLGPLTIAAESIGEKLKPKAESAKDKADKAVKDAKAKKAEIESKAKADKAKKEADLKAKKSAALTKVGDKGKEVAAEPKSEAEAKSAAIKSAAKQESDKLSHKVCAEMDASAGQCVADYLPNPGGTGGSSSIAATVSGEVTIPIPETPISAKVGQGAKVEVARTGAKSYTVGITGDAMLYANIGVGEGSSVDVKADLPGGGKGNLAKVWEKLGGAGAPKAAAPAAGASPTAAPGGGGTESKADLDLGYRAQTALVYGFTAGETNCQGLGGLVTLLGVLGIKGAGGFLGELAMLGAQDSFADSLQSRKFTIAEGVVMSGEVKNQFAKAGVKVGGEAGVTVGQQRDDKGKMVDTIELFVGGSGELTGEFEHDILSGIGGGIAGTGKLSVVLGYVADPATNTEDIEVVSLKGNATATASVAACNLNKIGDVAGPDVLKKIRELLQIDKTKLDPTMGSLTGEVNGVVDPTAAKTALRELLNDPEAATPESVKAKAKQVIKDTKTSGSASLTMTLTERLAGASVEAEEREPGANTGVKATATLDRAETRQLWSTTF